MSIGKKVKMRPVLDGDFWMIGDNPDLGELNGNRDPQAGKVQECVDHHIFKASDGKWHLWGCIRGTAVGRILYHWRSDHLTDEHWEQTGEYMRCDASSGESVRYWDGEVDSIAYVVRDKKVLHVYGGHSTNGICMVRLRIMSLMKAELSGVPCRGQICVMISNDGLNWQRYKNRAGQTRLFMGPGEARDPVLLKIGNEWYLYYAGGVASPDGELIPQIYVRTSEDLIHWSDWEVVHHDNSVNIQNSIWTHECPFVIEHAGYYYLFRTENYAQGRTHVYRSEDPKDFGIGEKAAQEKYVGILPVAAPEIITDDDGTQYISSSHNLTGGTMLCRLKWIED